MESSKQVPQCDVTVIHQDVVNRVKERLLPDELMARIAEFFRVFGDPTRIRILQVLFESEMCVCDIAYLLNMSQSAILPSTAGIEAGRYCEIPQRGPGCLLFP